MAESEKVDCHHGYACRAWRRVFLMLSLRLVHSHDITLVPLCAQHSTNVVNLCSTLAPACHCMDHSRSLRLCQVALLGFRRARSRHALIRSPSNESIMLACQRMVRRMAWSGNTCVADMDVCSLGRHDGGMEVKEILGGHGYESA